MSEKKQRVPNLIVNSPTEFRVENGYIVAVFTINAPQITTVGVRFESPEQLLTFCVELMETAAKVWPNHEAIKEYLSE